MKKCYWCNRLIKDSTLYICECNDYDIHFTGIAQIQYCPICGEKLDTLREKRLMELYKRNENKGNN